LTDLYLDPKTGRPRLDVLAPFVPSQGQTSAVLILNRDPQRYLFPLLQNWPTPSPSSETLLVRREGGVVRYLNDLRFKPDAALKFTMPISNTSLLAVKATEGPTRTSEGIDYRREPVLGALGRVGDTNWYLVAKVDRSEAFAGVAQRQWAITLAAILILGLVGLGLAFAWRQRSIDYLRRQLENERSNALLSEQYGLLTRYANDAVLLADENLNIVQANERAASLYGFSADELLGMTLEDLLEPGGGGLSAPLSTALLGGSGNLLQIRQRRADGSVITAEMSTRALSIDDQILYLTITRDLTDRTAAEEKLRESESRFRQLAESLPQLVWTCVPEGQCDYLSKKWLDYTGIPEEQQLGFGWLAQLHPDDRERTVAEWEKAVDAGTNFHAEFRIRRHDGEYRWFDTQAVRLRDESGATVKWFGSNTDITERRIAEDGLRETTAYLENLIGHANAPIIVWDPDLRITRFNHAFEEMSGLTSAEVIGKPLSVLFPKESLEQSLDQIARTTGGAYWETVEIPILRADGEIRVALWNSANVYDETSGGLVSTIAQGTDVTERLAAQQALETNRALLQSVISGTPDAIYAKDLHGRYLLFNHGAELATGKRAEDVLGRDDSILFPAAEAEIVMAADRAVNESGVAKTYDEHVTAADGSVRYFSTTKGPLLDGNGKTYGLFGFARDITNRKTIEDALSESEEKFRSIVQSSPTAIYLYHLESDGALILTSANPASDLIVGIDHSSLIGMTIEDAFPNLAGTEIPEMYRGVARGDLGSQSFEIPYTDDRLSGFYLVSVFQTGPGTAAVNFMDISERKRAEEELAARTEDLARSNADLEKFAYIASHDLQEPLRMVASYTQLLQRRYAGRLDADADEFIAYAVDGATRMQRLINDLLAYSRAGSQGSAFEETDLEAVLQGVLKTLSISIAEAGAEITYDPMPSVVCDPIQIGQVFQNLIINAIKFRGEDPPRIHVGVESSEEEWVFSVKDNGLGIEPEYFDRIFVIFQRLQSRADYPGTGMGLAICKRIIERHGGRTWVESGEGIGSTFYFTLAAKGKDHHVG
jgi:PAS domain S-box-containing protein